MAVLILAFELLFNLILLGWAFKLASTLIAKLLNLVLKAWK